MRLVVDSFDLYLTVFHIATKLLIPDLFSLSYRACDSRGERERELGKKHNKIRSQPIINSIIN